MIKASAGGGGKGLRIAWNDKECRQVMKKIINLSVVHLLMHVIYVVQKELISRVICSFVIIVNSACAEGLQCILCMSRPTVLPCYWPYFTLSFLYLCFYILALASCDSCYQCTIGSMELRHLTLLHCMVDIDLCPRLWSATNTALVVPSALHSTIGDRTFPVVARVWNSPPQLVTSSPLLTIFQQRFKTELFVRSYESD